MRLPQYKDNERPVAFGQIGGTAFGTSGQVDHRALCTGIGIDPASLADNSRQLSLERHQQLTP